MRRKVASMPGVKRQVTRGRRLMWSVLTFKDALPDGLADRQSEVKAYTIEHLRGEWCQVLKPRALA